MTRLENHEGLTNRLSSSPRSIVVIAASPSAVPRSSEVARILVESLADVAPARWIALRDFDAADLLFSRTSAAVDRLVASVRSSHAVVVATPVYKGTYSGALKVILDALPPDALTDRPVLGLATARLDAHGRAAARALDELFDFFDARRAASTVVVRDHEIARVGSRAVLSADAGARLVEAAGRLRDVITGVRDRAATA